MEREKAQALAGSQPDAVAFDSFRKDSDVHVADDEVSIITSLPGEAGGYVSLSSMVSDYIKDEGHSLLMWIALGLFAVLCLVSFGTFRRTPSLKAEMVARSPETV